MLKYRMVGTALAISLFCTACNNSEPAAKMVEAQHIQLEQHNPAEIELAQSMSQGYSDVSSSLIRSDLSSRGVDPLVGTSSELRRAFVMYDVILGDARNLNSEQVDEKRAVNQLNQALSETGLFSTVHIKTAEPGARIKYKLLGQESNSAFPELTNQATDQLAIGMYSVWAERAGTKTSKPILARIIRSPFTLDIEEGAY